jgi:hypothetical protein
VTEHRSSPFKGPEYLTTWPPAAARLQRRLRLLDRKIASLRGPAAAALRPQARQVAHQLETAKAEVMRVEAGL